MANDNAPEPPSFFVAIGTFVTIVGALVWRLGNNTLDTDGHALPAIGIVVLAIGVAMTLPAAVAAGVAWGMRRVQ